MESNYGGIACFVHLLYTHSQIEHRMEAKRPAAAPPPIGHENQRRFLAHKSGDKNLSERVSTLITAPFGNPPVNNADTTRGALRYHHIFCNLLMASYPDAYDSTLR